MKCIKNKTKRKPKFNLERYKTAMSKNKHELGGYHGIFYIEEIKISELQITLINTLSNKHI